MHTKYIHVLVFHFIMNLTKLFCYCLLQVHQLLISSAVNVLPLTGYRKENICSGR